MQVAELTTLEVAYTFFPELKNGNPISTPLVRWNQEENFSLYLLCSSKLTRHELFGLEELVTNAFVKGQKLKLLSYKHSSISTSEQRTYILMEFVFEGQRAEADLAKVAEQLNFDKRVFPIPFETQISSSVKAKISSVNQATTRIIKRFPKRFDRDFIKKVEHFFIHVRDDFIKLHDVNHLSRIIALQYLFEKRLHLERKAFPNRRHIYCKIMHGRLRFPFGKKKVFGVIVSLNFFSEYELFSYRHILQALKIIVPGIEAIEDSYYSQHDHENHHATYYLEIEAQALRMTS